MKLKFFILIVSTIALTLSVKAQPGRNESQLAMQYFQNKEWEKASQLYESLFQKTKSNVYFSYYLQCLVELDDFKGAEKAVNKQIKQNPLEVSFYVELGYIYTVRGESEKAKEYYETAIKKLPASRNEIINLANGFLRKREFAFAEEAYLKGRRLLKDEYIFNFELASVYQSQRKYQQMIDEYLNLLEKHEAYIQSVQNNLQNAVYNDVDDNLQDLLKKSLLLRIQKNPGISIYSDLLIWLYIQEKNFESALQQSIAVDKRNKELGERVIDLARMAVKNEEYETAVKAYEYVNSFGWDSPYYLISRNEYAGALFRKVLSSHFTQADIINLEQCYLNAMKDLGEKAETALLIKELCHIQGFYLGKFSEAIERLEKALEIPNTDYSVVAQIKIELADLLLLSGDEWEAILYYGQVEKANKNNPFGYDAKLKKAKLAYFQGDFKWAQAQLDVLKASTSKLIANDAFELSQLITDNTILDTTELAMKMYAHADLLFFRNQDSLALATLDSIPELFKGHSLTDEIAFKKGQVMMKRNEYSKAIEFFGQVANESSSDLLADDAIFLMASIYENKLGDKEKAKSLYKQLLLEYPGSIYIVDARKKFRMLRGDVMNKEEMFFYGIESNP